MDQITMMTPTYGNYPSNTGPTILICNQGPVQISGQQVWNGQGQNAPESNHEKSITDKY